MKEDYLENGKVCFITLGCKVNQTESEAMAQLFRAEGYEVVSRAEEAGVVVINTCTVTNTGDSKSRQMIRRMIKAHPQSFVVVMGCYAQTAPGEVMEIEGVDLVLGTQDRTGILNWIAAIKQDKQPQNRVYEYHTEPEFEELPQLEKGSRTRATLKVEDGCSQFCTYCIIPYARGPVRSRRPESALDEACGLVEAGYGEIVLTGIHLGAYGQDFKAWKEPGHGNGEGGEWDLARLVGRMLETSGLKRLRLSSIEPMEVTSQLVALYESSEILCPHLHIPLQSGSQTVLERMNRPYSLAQYKELLETLRQRLPDLAVTTDVITGFPGEREEDHRQALEFIRQCAFARIHVFPYSKRQGTPAADYPNQISQKVKEERVRDLLEVGKISRDKYIRRFLGRTMDVLIERVDEQGYGYGHTDNYLEVKIFPEEGKWREGQQVMVTLKENHILENHLIVD